MQKTNYGKRANGSKKRTDGLITPWALIMMSILMLYSFGNITSNYVGLGWSAAPAFIAAILLYLLPFSFIIAELATLKLAKNSNAGFMKWIEAGIGRKMAFITAYMFWFANLFYFVGSTPGSITNAAYGIFGKDMTGGNTFNAMLPYLTVLLFAGITWISTWKLKNMSIITSFGGSVTLFLTFLFFAIAAVGLFAGDWGIIVEKAGDQNTFISDVAHPEYTFFTNTDGSNYVTNVTSGEYFNYSIKGGEVILGDQAGTITLEGGINLQIATGSHLENWYYFPQAPGMANGTEHPNFWGEAGGMNYVWFSTFVWVMMAADGAQGLGVYVNKVEGGQKSFSRAIFISIMFVATIYVFGTLLVSVFAPTGLANGKYTSFALMFYYSLAPIFGTDPATKAAIVTMSNHIIGIIMFIVGTGGLLLWTSAPVKTFFSEIPAGVFGSALTKQNKNGSPYRAAWLQFFIVVPLFLIPAFGSTGLEDFLNSIKTMSGSIGMIPPLIIFIAYFMIRLKHDDLERSFKMGPRWFGLGVSTMIIIVFSFILFMSYFAHDPTVGWWEDKEMWSMALYQTVGLIIFVLPVYFWYARYDKNQKILAISKEEGYNELNATLNTRLNKKSMVVFYDQAIREDCKKQVAKLNAKYENLYSVAETEYKKEFDAFVAQRIKHKEDGVPITLENPGTLKKALKLIDVEYKQEFKVIKDDFKQKQATLMNFVKAKALKEKEQLHSSGLLHDEKYSEIEPIHNTVWNVSQGDVPLPSENEIVADFEVMRDYSIVPQDSITDRLVVTKDKFILYYIDGGKYAVDVYRREDTVVNSNEKITYIKNNGEEHKLESFKFNNHDLGNIFVENLFIKNSDEFEKLI